MSISGMADYQYVAPIHVKLEKGRKRQRMQSLHTGQLRKYFYITHVVSKGFPHNINFLQERMLK